jgi:hypothetical protein
MRVARFTHLWAWPLGLTAASLLGLVAALLGDGVYDAVGWVGLGVPVAIGGWHWARR